MPAGRSPKLDAHQPAAISRPTAAPVTCQGHFPRGACACERKSQKPPATHSAAMTIHGERPRAEASVGGASATVMTGAWSAPRSAERSEEHTSELQSQSNLVCRLLLEKKK